MRPFRVELLWAEALPRELVCPLTALLSKGDPGLTRAATSFLSHIARHREFLKRVDYHSTHAELRSWNSRDFWRLTREERKRSTYTAWLVEAYEETYDYLNDSFFSLVAIGLLASEVTLEAALEVLKEQSWATRHEVLTRWAWVREHRRLLQQGVQLGEPYSCTVARRGRPERGPDREFYQLLWFLHCLRFVTGEEFLVASKQETPDFILHDRGGGQLGAEMTEASVSDAWNMERDAEEQILDIFRLSTEALPLNLHLLEPPSWLPLLERLADIDRWWRAKLEELGGVEERMTFSNDELGLTVELSPSERFWLSWSDPRGKTGSDIERESLELQATLRARIERKIIRKGRPRQAPSIRPCHLVVYPNHDLGQELEQAILEFFRHPPVDVQSHFDAVWLSSENRLVRLN